MTDPKEKIKLELAEYVAMEEHLDKRDRLLMLTAIFEKFFIFEKAGHLITDGDILLISGLAKTSYNQLSLPAYVGNKKVEYDDLRTLAFAEAMIGYMNLHHLSRKEVQINYKRSK